MKPSGQHVALITGNVDGEGYPVCMNEPILSARPDNDGLHVSEGMARGRRGPLSLSARSLH